MTNPTPKIVNEELPFLVQEHGITSVKLYMTYDAMKLRDREILDIMVATRRLGMTSTYLLSIDHQFENLY